MADFLESLMNLGRGPSAVADVPVGGFSPVAPAASSPLALLEQAGLGDRLTAFNSAQLPLADAGPSLLQSLIGYTKADGTKVNGWGGTALGLGNALSSGLMAMKNYGLAKDQLKQQQQQFMMNYDTQRKLTNTYMEDRQRARMASNPGAYESVSDYMKKNGV